MSDHNPGCNSGDASSSSSLKRKERQGESDDMNNTAKKICDNNITFEELKED